MLQFLDFTAKHEQFFFDLQLQLPLLSGYSASPGAQFVVLATQFCELELLLSQQVLIR